MSRTVEIYGREVAPAFGSYIVPDEWSGSHLPGYGGSYLTGAGTWENCFRLPSARYPGVSYPVEITVTGRTFQHRGNNLYVRVRIKFIGEPSERSEPGWMRVDD